MVEQGPVPYEINVRRRHIGIHSTFQSDKGCVDMNMVDISGSGRIQLGYYKYLFMTL